MREIKTGIKTFMSGEDGAALIEYGMLVLLVARLCSVAVKSIGSKVSNGFNSANTLLP
jgi:Flp pilus assembly pilin Flp